MKQPEVMKTRDLTESDKAKQEFIKEFRLKEDDLKARAKTLVNGLPNAPFVPEGFLEYQYDETAKQCLAILSFKSTTGPVVQQVSWNGKALELGGSRVDIHDVYGLKPFKRNPSRILTNPQTPQVGENGKGTNGNTSTPADASLRSSNGDTKSFLPEANRRIAAISDSSLLHAWREKMQRSPYGGYDTAGINAVETRGSDGTPIKIKLWDMFRRAFGK